jgi:predicted dinucleotide-binding enzyme
MSTLDVGIIGAGRLGQAMARTALRAGRRIVLANSRGPESLASLVSTLGEETSAGTASEAAGADIVVIAVPWPRVGEAVEGLRWDGRISLVSGGAMQQLGGPLAGVNLIQIPQAS